MNIFYDLETYSEEPISSGSHVYAAHPSTRVTVFNYVIDEGPAREHDLSDCDSVIQWPREIHELLTLEGAIWIAHNSAFDATVLDAQGFHIPLEQRRCSMVRAYEHALPGALDSLCEVLKVPLGSAKVKISRDLMFLFCKPRPKNHKVRRATKHTHPEEWAKFLEYARGDVLALREVWRRMPAWNHDPASWHMDQRINDRGFLVDTVLVNRMIELVHDETIRLDTDMRTRTVTEANATGVGAGQRDKLLLHLMVEHGVVLPDLKGSILEPLLGDERLPDEVKQLLAIRLEASTASASKYKRLRSSTSSDGRCRGTLQHCGAARTRRKAGRRFQPQNLPRPTMDWADIARDIDLVKTSNTADLLLKSVMETASNAARSVIIAPPRKKLAVADLSNIEGRGAAWLCGEQWKLDAFADFDRGVGADLYCVSYGRSFGVDPFSIVKGDPRRQIGKVLELAMQYEGGVGAFVAFAMVYRVDLDALPALVFESAPTEVRLEAESFFDWCLETGRPTFGLARDTFVACDILKRLWRRAHPAITSAWRELRSAFVRQVTEPIPAGIRVGRMIVERRGSWVTLLLPSGKRVCYPAARVSDSGQCSYAGVQQWNRKLGRINTHGGKTLENATQSVSYDVLDGGCARAEARGYDVVLSVHDELIAETYDGSGEELAGIMAEGETWTTGLPLAAHGSTMDCYRKED